MPSHGLYGFALATPNRPPVAVRIPPNPVLGGSHVTTMRYNVYHDMSSHIAWMDTSSLSMLTDTYRYLPILIYPVSTVR